MPFDRRYRFRFMLRLVADADGFTLLELLVAISLLGIVLAMAAGGLRFGLTAWEKGDNIQQRSSELRSSQHLLRRLIEQLYPALNRTNSGYNAVLFVGEPSEIIFVGPPPAQLSPPGTYRIRVAIKQQADSRTLTLSWHRMEPDRSDFTASEPEETVALINHIADASFSYYGIIAQDTVATWHDHWIDQRSAPLLIEVKVQYQNGDKRLWPILIVAPRVPSIR